MANRIYMTIEQVPDWMASTGFLFPTNELELARFEKLYPAEEVDVSGFSINFDQIFSNSPQKKILTMSTDVPVEKIEPLKMVARKGVNLPKHIQDKIKKNQDQRNHGDQSNKEE